MATLALKGGRHMMPEMTFFVIVGVGYVAAKITEFIVWLDTGRWR